MNIKRKSSVAHITPKYTVNYSPDTFEEQKEDFFVEVSAEELLARVQPKTFDFLPNERFIGIDTETYYTGVGNNRMPSNVIRRWIQQQGKTKYIPNDFPFCISISDGTCSYVVYDTLENKFAEFKKLKPLLCDTTISKVGHNLGYDLHMLANARVDLKGRIHDTLILSKLTRAFAFTHNLLDITKELQSEGLPTVTKFEYMVKSYKASHKITDYRMIPHELMTQYTAADTWNTLYALEALYPIMLENEQLRVYDLECEMLKVAYTMERDGMSLSPEYEHILIPELVEECDEAERKIYEIAGTTFNINSGKQLESVLIGMGYGALIKYNKPTEKMQSQGRTKGNPKFTALEMERLENEGVPLVNQILKYRKSTKLLNTFALKLYDMRDYNYVVHCNINTIEAKTGRFSISAPSMQNMPRRKDDRVRGAFIAPEGYTLYDYDFKSQESIVLAHYSRSEFLLDKVKKGKDIHKATASLVYNVDVEDVTPDQRQDAKSVGFAVTYGAGAPKVAAMTGKSVAEAKYIIRMYMHNIPEVQTFINTANKVVKEGGKIRTRLGRHVYTERGREYACVNYVIQGSSADSTKTRMVEIYKFLKANACKTYMVLQVHDSLLYCIADDEADTFLGYLKWLQTERELFRVPVAVDVGICIPTWRDKKDIEVEDIKPPEEMLEKMHNYNIWEEGLF